MSEHEQAPLLRTVSFNKKQADALAYQLEEEKHEKKLSFFFLCYLLLSVLISLKFHSLVLLSFEKKRKKKERKHSTFGAVMLVRTLLSCSLGC